MSSILRFPTKIKNLIHLHICICEAKQKNNSRGISHFCCKIKKFDTFL